MVLLETARLRLRQFTSDDVDRLVELDSDPEVMRYVTFGAPTPRERYVDVFLPRWFAIYRETPLLGYWAAEERATSEFHGWFHLRPDRIDAGEQELGYRLRRASWGRGFATEGAAALVEHGFRQVGADKISARALAGNAASRAVMGKCGLRYETDFVYPQDMIGARSAAECAAVKYSITRSQWQAARTA
jgi:RimJ/RimL family protein N-acetyltransferase